MILLPSKFKSRGGERRGFTILYAALVSSLLLSISLGIYNISIKQYVLSSSAIDSQLAIYTADGAIECAIYWDAIKGVFESPNEADNASVSSQIKCGEDDITTATSYDTGEVTTRFETNFSSSASGDLQCAKVKIEKKWNDSNTDVITRIESRGYNYCTTNPRKVERALRVTYPIDPATGLPIE
ncbi:MAG: hypothetical protein A3G52_03910 [Candidatus Taylorbacteria bacterium RIFCSPLOWO2_12_FULL_43_20]|uniref:Type 4 fimbrial biogenesis protein PilX N-terminal domain-containing protein n=1 Tax=Candidatus Taylorbacteria bacterium RIFCSPLOWO2_12_FULL_43_20 TaxID=1802332 RepID=A0A1G2P203_9BACT|nr:MAG: hypothetical protein A2825_02215 [Candidatus Taylorbacteria bacterium RIFCSPHIGHO2_01_FULL_43_120]OHA22836.1 MAG: hypothetical protein A3B98_01420 [Candidatus Taylorbacteria bacterium RIFCSPHIGHO2_02_FULL_43_55]OHA29383.1 MAG: hypothetical protein A3E92_02485 [Candidatus Taylorbacteria bacterium RIFCSPHIGHO2_12_FULL_42_34]OHA31759.1 MAG: hypothetical protein A3B09_01925 [Candidatus Taylorbacteria bacterium RIFCSPLOWO2_01_FULL_43_83]OHA38574.1 MAG: hypothetical protein A3H58_00210 [Candi